MLNMIKGSDEPNIYKIKIKKSGRNYREIHEDISNQLKEHNYVWFKDYYIYFGDGYLVLEIYNNKINKIIPDIIIEDLL